jgi:hypothetical protein
MVEEAADVVFLDRAAEAARFDLLREAVHRLRRRVEDRGVADERPNAVVAGAQLDAIDFEDAALARAGGDQTGGHGQAASGSSWGRPSDR